MRTSLRNALATVTLTAALFGSAAACSSAGSAAPPPTTVATAPSSTTSTAPEAAPAATNRIARLDRATDVHEQPSSTSPVITTLEARTELGSATALRVLDERDGWLQVSLPVRPNGSTGWVAADGVEQRKTTLRVEVDLEARELRLFDGDEVIERSAIAVGASDTPTPTGEFFVTDLVDTGEPDGAYGPYAIGLSAHSDTLTEFAGGDGQVGIHGTNDPSSIGNAVSHGCIRLPNEVVGRLIELVPLGTPVTIH